MAKESRVAQKFSVEGYPFGADASVLLNRHRDRGQTNNSGAILVSHLQINLLRKRTV